MRCTQKDAISVTGVEKIESATSYKPFNTAFQNGGEKRGSLRITLTMKASVHEPESNPLSSL